MRVVNNKEIGTTTSQGAANTNSKILAVKISAPA
jgi:hypothetical protein